MDTELDTIEQNKPEILGATEKRFLEWINYNVGIEIRFHDKCYVTERFDMMQYLIDTYWKDYIHDLEWAYQDSKSRA